MDEAVTISDILAGAILLIVLANILLSAYVLHKVRRVHLATYDIRNDIELSTRGIPLFRQLQALHGLYRDLRLTHALPHTREWAASPDFLSVLVQHVSDRRPQRVVECGSGVSTLVLARCMQLNGTGRVLSLDHDARYAEQTRRNLERHGLSEWAEVIHAPIREHALGGDRWKWYDLRELADVPIDMLVVDGPPMPLGRMVRYPAGPLLFPRLAPGAAVFVDDADRRDERRIVARWLEENPDFREERLDCEKGCAVLRQPSARPSRRRDDGAANAGRAARPSDALPA